MSFPWFDRYLRPYVHNIDTSFEKDTRFLQISEFS